MSYEHFTELMDDTRAYIQRMREFLKFQKEFDAKWSALAHEIDNASPDQKAAFEVISEELKSITEGL